MMDSSIIDALNWLEDWFRLNNENSGGRHHCPCCYHSNDDGIHDNGAPWKYIEHDPLCVIGKSLSIIKTENDSKKELIDALTRMVICYGPGYHITADDDYKNAIKVLCKYNRKEQS